MGLSITREMIRYRIRPWAHFSIVTRARCHLFYRSCSAFWLVPGPGLPSCETDFIKELRGALTKDTSLKNNRLKVSLGVDQRKINVLRELLI